MHTDASQSQPLPPHSLEAEQAMLGALLVDNAAWDRISDLVRCGDLYSADHRAIWTALESLIERGRPADPLLVQEALRQAGTLDDVGGLAYLSALVVGVATSRNVRHYAEIVRDRAILRRLAAAAAEITETALAHGADAQEAAERAEAAVLAVSDAEARDAAREPEPLKTAVFEAVDWIEGTHAPGVRTGYAKLDAMFPGGDGLQPEQLVVVAGRPSMGKSSLAWCIAEHAAASGHHVAYFALETSRRELGRRALRYHESLTSRTEATRYLSGLPLVIDDSPEITLSHLRIRLRRIRRRHGLALVVIDYVQLMRHRAQDRLQEVSAISRGLKAVAKEFCVPVVAVCQINRAAEGRADRRPLLSDLRESGQLEQDADAVLMLYRDEYYNEASHLAGYGEVLVRKMRDGPTGDVLLRWDGERTRWIDYAGEWPSPPVPTVQAGSASVRAFRARREEAGA